MSVGLFVMTSDLLSPRRELLVDQVAAVLRREIAHRRWPDWLPSERSLIALLNVSRPTLRGALHQLVASQELGLYPRQGDKVLGASKRAAPSRAAAPEIGLLCPEQVYSMPSYVVQLVDRLRSLCAESNLPFEVMEGARFARNDPGRFMPRLVRNHPKACWIPVMADRRMQEWFARSGTPTVIYGNVYPDMRLPAVGIDYHAGLRHAAALLMAKGHRRLALITHDPRRAGEQESVAGFRAAAQQAAEVVEAVVMARPDDDATALSRQIDRLLQGPRAPTAIIVSRTHHYATVATRVLELGRLVPADVSLLCRGEDPFLHFLSPTPAFYRVNIEALARRLFRAVLRVATGSTPPQEQQRVLPEFVAGASIGPAPREAKGRDRG